MLAPNQPAYVGKAAIRAFVQQSKAIPRFSITWEPEHAVKIWRRDASGAWQCVVDTWNDNPTERVLPR